MNLPCRRRAFRARVFVRALPFLLLALACSAGAGEAHWIDVRSAEEYAEGHIEQAVNIPYTEITERIDEVTTDRDAPIYLYCRSGRRSGIALEALQQAGFTHVTNLGGLEEARRAAARLEACKKGPSPDC